MIEPSVVLALLENYERQPEEISWSDDGTVGEAVNASMCAVKDGLVYFINIANSTIRIYDALTRTFTTLASISNNTGNAVFHFLDDDSIVIGDRNKSLHKYVLSTNSVVTLKSMSYEGMGGGFANDGFLHMFGGYTTISGCTETRNSHYKYDHYLNTWSSVSSNTISRHNMLGVSAPNGLYLFGGSESSDCSGNTYKTTRRFDAVANTLTTLAGMNDTATGRMFLHSDGKRIIKIARNTEFAIYDIEKNAWTGNLGLPSSLKGSSAPRSASFLAFVLGTKVYVLGGGINTVEYTINVTKKQMARNALIGYVFGT